MKIIVVALITILLMGCASQPKTITHINQFPELDIQEDGTETSFSITTFQYRGNELGEIQDITGYRVFYQEKKLADGSCYYRFYKMEKSDAVADIQKLVWKKYDQITEFRVIVDSNNDINSVKKYIDQIPHDGMETYNIYVSLMDILMYHRYVQLSKKYLSGEKQVYEIPATNYQASDWDPVVRNIRFIETPTYIYAIGKNEKGDNVYYYKNDGTIIYQTISTGILVLPSKGTTRFMGFITTDLYGTISSANLSEYFAMEIWPLFFMKMNMLVRREQILEKLK